MYVFNFLPSQAIQIMNSHHYQRKAFLNVSYFMLQKQQPVTHLAHRHSKTEKTPSEIRGKFLHLSFLNLYKFNLLFSQNVNMTL